MLTFHLTSIFGDESQGYIYLSVSVVNSTVCITIGGIYLGTKCVCTCQGYVYIREEDSTCQEYIFMGEECVYL